MLLLVLASVWAMVGPDPGEAPVILALAPSVHAKVAPAPVEADSVKLVGEPLHIGEAELLSGPLYKGVGFTKTVTAVGLPGQLAGAAEVGVTL